MLLHSEDAEMQTCLSRIYIKKLKHTFTLTETKNVKLRTSAHCFVLQQMTNLGEVLSHDLNEVRHGKIHDVVPPGQLQHHIWVQQVIGSEQAGGEALLPALLQEPLQQSLCQLSILRLCGVQHGILGGTAAQRLIDSL